MNHSRTMRLGLALTGLGILGTLEARPAAAQDLTYTLYDVTFSDGAVAYGSFQFNGTNGSFGTFDITTTNGVTDSLTGTHYTNISPSYETVRGYQAGFGLAPGTYFGFGANLTYQPFEGFVPNNYVDFLSTDTGVLGLDTITPGSDLYPVVIGIGNSGEEVDGVTRTITGGSLFVTTPVPEASTTVSFGLLLALGLSGGVIAARRKKAAVSASF